MWTRTIIAPLILPLILIVCINVWAEDKEDRTGTVSGMVVAKGGNWIEVKADGEEKPRKYYTGSDPVALKAVKETEVGSCIRLEWRFREVYRVAKIEVLKPPPKKE